MVPTPPTVAPSTTQYRPEPIFRIHDIASEWKLSIDTVQRLFANEPDVFVIKSGRKRTLRIRIR